MAVNRDFPERFLKFNARQTKDLAVVVEIPGIDLLSNRTIYTRIRYGDPGIDYGDPGVIYGGLRVLEGVRSLINWEQSNLSLSQKLEPEQGRASISTISMAFTDKDTYMTKVVSPGVLIPEILSTPVNIYIGYAATSFPEDYIKIFRGRITDVQEPPAMVVLQFSDPNFARKGQAFITGKTKLVGDIMAGDTTINVLDNTDFHKHILGPDGLYDVAGPWNRDGTHNPSGTRTTGVRTFFKIDEEYIEYGPLGFGTNSFTNVLRGALGTTADAHDSASDVEAAVQFSDNAMELALKTMLSGFAGPWLEDVTVFSIMRTFDGTLLDQPRALILPSRKDAIRDYGLFEGDYITVTGATESGNNGTFRIVRFAELFDEPNRIIYVDSDLTPEFPTNAKMAFRSQFDTYPITCGVALTPEDVDVDKHAELRDKFMSGVENQLEFFQTNSESLKSFLEREVYLPTAAYSLTQRGRLSVGYHVPPLASTRLVVINKDNIKNPDQIRPMRGLNNRKFFNEIDFDIDYDKEGTAHGFFRFVDVNSVSRFGVSSPLPIAAKGVKTKYGTVDVFTRRARRFLSRYKNGSTLFQVTVLWGIGVQIEAGDIIALQDEGFLQIANFDTGKRNLGTVLVEVLDRNLDIKNGHVPLTLINGIGADVNDRFAIISPSSEVVSGSNEFLIIQDSFSKKFPGDEMRKWRNFVGQRIVLHDENYTYYEQTTIMRLDPINNYKMYISGLASLPGDFAGLIIDIPRYPESTSKTLDSMYKQLFAHFGARVPIASGASPTQFDVNSGDEVKFFVGAKIRVHTEDYSSTSPEVTVTNIFGVTISVNTPLGFTPDNTYYVTGIGFRDKQGVYRYI